MSAENEFKLLEHLGGEVAGALTLLPAGEAPQPASDGTPEVLSDERLVALLDRLPIRPLMPTKGAVRQVE